MSTEFESFVRPFQTNNVTPAQTYYMPGEIGVPNVILRIGQSGSGKTLTGNFSYSESIYMSKYETERKTPPGRKTQHHSQFVGKFGQGVIGKPMGK